MKNEIIRFIQANNMVADEKALEDFKKGSQIKCHKKYNLNRITNIHGENEITYLLSKLPKNDLIYVLSTVSQITDSLKDTYTVLQTLGLIEEVDFDGEFDLSII